MNVYQDYLFKKNPQPKQLTTIKEDSKDNYSTSTDNSSKNISLNDKKISGMNERKKNMRSKCIEAMGKRQFEDIYTYQKVSREKNVDDRLITKTLIDKYGKQCKNYIFDIDQLIFFEDTYKC